MSEELTHRIINHLNQIYPELDQETLAQSILDKFFPDGKIPDAEPVHHPLPNNREWSEKTSILITYGDTIVEEGEVPLKTLKNFLDNHLKDAVDAVHILPFFPFSSDDGFAVMEYTQVREDLGTWEDIQAIGQDYKLMSDMVINHASSRGGWFEGFLKSEEPYKDFFYTADPEQDISAVVRPRPSPLLTAFDTAEGLKHVWCTFGPDQVDLDFSNPDVLLEFVRIMRFYLDNQVRIFRLDAVAFLWKEVGTTCIHLPQTHEIIRLMRTLCDFYNDNVLIITETNVPNQENLSYFGNQNEAHLIYNFSLPPLLIQALLTGSEYYLKRWLMEQPPTQNGCAYLNFVAGHDGIGLRPATGILLEEDLQEMIRTIRSFGGEISMRTGPDGEQSPYEMNIALFDALKGTIKGEDKWQCQRFLAAHAIMMAMEGVPAFYIHSLLSTPNDTEKFRATGHKRHINRHQYQLQDLIEGLKDLGSDKSFVLSELKRMIKVRSQNPCFHPNATQFTLQLPEGFFGFWRHSLDRTQDTFCITNLRDEDLTLPLHHLNMHSGVQWKDLLTEQVFETRDEELIVRPYQSLWISC